MLACNIMECFSQPLFSHVKFPLILMHYLSVNNTINQQKNLVMSYLILKQKKQKNGFHPHTIYLLFIASLITQLMQKQCWHIN